MPRLSAKLGVGAKVACLASHFGKEWARETFPETPETQRVIAKVIADENKLDPKTQKPVRYLKIELNDPNPLIEHLHYLIEVKAGQVSYIPAPQPSASGIGRGGGVAGRGGRGGGRGGHATPAPPQPPPGPPAGPLEEDQESIPPDSDEEPLEPEPPAVHPSAPAPPGAPPVAQGPVAWTTDYQEGSENNMNERTQPQFAASFMSSSNITSIAVLSTRTTKGVKDLLCNAWSTPGIPSGGPIDPSLSSSASPRSMS